MSKSSSSWFQAIFGILLKIGLMSLVWFFLFLFPGISGSAFAAYEPDWSNIDVRPFYLLDPPEISNPVLTATDVTDIDAEFVADPFLFYENNTWYMFFEVLNVATGLGEIGLATSLDGFDWQYDSVVLSESKHLSFPQVFKYNDQYYMMPETNEWGEIRLYKSNNFPYNWTYLSTILSGRAFVDPSIFRYNDKWWLFAGASYKEPDFDSSFLFYSDDLLNGWVEHPMSPIVDHVAEDARPGGRSFVYNNDHVIRIAQKIDVVYGQGVKAFEVDTLTETDYSEHEIPEDPILMETGSGWNATGMHHFDPWWNGNLWVCAVDGRDDDNVWSIGIFRTINPSGDAYHQGAGENGFVSIEVEHFNQNIIMDPHKWELVYPSGYSGSGAMMAMPNIGGSYEMPDENSPRMDYNVNFKHTGVHYIWVRGTGSTDMDDSVHIGIDGDFSSANGIVAYNGSTWSWSNFTTEGLVATLEVSRVGLHTLNVCMAKDGFVLDKLVLTKSSSEVVSGSGPIESYRSNVVSAPQINPEGGEFDDSVTILLISETEGADIYYTLDGTNPNPSSYLYTGPLELTGSATLKAIAILENYSDSAIVNASFSIVPINDKPVIVGQKSISTEEEVLLGITLDDLLVTDPDNTYPNDFILSILDGSDYAVEGNNIIPVTNFYGFLTVPVTVDDGSGDANSKSDVYNLIVEVTGVNDAPVIVTTAPENVLEGSAYQYQPVAIDEENDTLIWSLVNAPAGMTIDSITGLIPWVPGEMVSTSGEVVLSVVDDKGGLDSESFTITVSSDEDLDQDGHGSTRCFIGILM